MPHAWRMPQRWRPQRRSEGRIALTPSLRGAERRGNPSFFCAVKWIASLRSQRRRRDLDSNQRVVKIPPFRVQRFDQSQFLCATTGLDLLFPRDRLDHSLVQFVPDEEFAAVFGREAFHEPLTVLERALWQVGRNAGVERPAMLACEDVNAGLLHRPSSSRPGYSVIARSAATRQSIFLCVVKWIASLRSQ
jgi:hypothetical protein